MPSAEARRTAMRTAAPVQRRSGPGDQERAASAGQPQAPPLPALAIAAPERRWCAVLCALLLALLLVGLGNASLWEDEAGSAVLGEHTLTYGLPYASDGRSTVTRERGMDANDQGLWIFEPWLPFYVTAASLALCGRTQFGARFLPALCGWLAVLVVLRAVRSQSKAPGAPAFTAVLFATSVPYLLYCRQSRYYPLVFLSEALFIAAFLNLRLEVRSIALCSLALILLFYTHPLTFAIFLPGGLLAGLLFGRTRLISLVISAAVAALAALPWVLYSGMLGLGSRGVSVPGAGPTGVASLLSHGLAGAIEPYYWPAFGLSLLCLPLLRARTRGQVSRDPLLRLALPLSLTPAAVAAPLAAANVCGANERFVLVTLIPGLLALAVFLSYLAQDRRWLGRALPAVIAVTPLGLASPFAVGDTLPALRATPLRSPLWAFGRESLRRRVTATDAIVRFIRARRSSTGSPTLFVDWNPEGVMFHLPEIEIARDVPFRQPPQWVVLRTESPTLLNYTLIGRIGEPPPVRASYVLTIRRAPMEAAADLQYVQEYVRTHPYRAISLPVDLPDDNSPELYKHVFPTAAPPLQITLYDYQGSTRQRQAARAGRNGVK